jgi:hypothetical protein
VADLDEASRFGALESWGSRYDEALASGSLMRRLTKRYPANPSIHRVLGLEIPAHEGERFVDALTA